MGVNGHTQSLHWKLTLGEKYLTAPGNQTCISSMMVWYSINELHPHNPSYRAVVLLLMKPPPSYEFLYEHLRNHHPFLKPLLLHFFWWPYKKGSTLHKNCTTQHICTAWPKAKSHLKKEFCSSRVPLSTKTVLHSTSALRDPKQNLTLKKSSLLQGFHYTQWVISESLSNTQCCI